MLYWGPVQNWVGVGPVPYDTVSAIVEVSVSQDTYFDFAKNIGSVAEIQIWSYFNRWLRPPHIVLKNRGISVTKTKKYPSFFSNAFSLCAIQKNAFEKNRFNSTLYNFQIPPKYITMSRQYRSTIWSIFSTQNFKMRKKVLQKPKFISAVE